MSAGGKRGEHIESAAVGMGQWEERQASATLEVEFRLHAKHHIAGEIVECEHYTLAESGGS